MDETRETLLVRLHTSPDDASWMEFDDLYRPFLASWYLRRGVQHADADDLVQDTLIRTRAGLAGFQRQRVGSFRKWLGMIAHRTHVDWSRQSRPGALSLADQADLADNTEWESAWDREHDEYLVDRLLERVRRDFEPNTFKLFQMVVLDQISPEEVAAACGLAVTAVYAARARVLARLRQEAGGFMD